MALMFVTSHPLYSREVGHAYGDGDTGQLGGPLQGRVLEHQHHVVVVPKQQVDGALRYYGGSDEGEIRREERVLLLSNLNGTFRPVKVVNVAQIKK